MIALAEFEGCEPVVNELSSGCRFRFIGMSLDQAIQCLHIAVVVDTCADFPVEMNGGNELHPCVGIHPAVVVFPAVEGIIGIASGGVEVPGYTELHPVLVRTFVHVGSKGPATATVVECPGV